MAGGTQTLGSPAGSRQVGYKVSPENVLFLVSGRQAGEKQSPRGRQLALPSPNAP